MLNFTKFKTLALLKGLSKESEIITYRIGKNGSYIFDKDNYPE